MRNWTIKDAVAVIQNGKDTESIREIAKHFPVFFMAVAKNDLGAVAAMMTDKMTVRRLQMEAAEGEEDSDEDADDEVEEAEATDDADTSDDGGEDLESMSTKQLIALCGKRGIKVPKYGKNKKFYLDALQGGAEEAEAEDDGDGDAEDDPYAGKNAIQLYGLCKKRGMKVKPKQKAAVYLEALKKADAAEAEGADDQDQDDDWGEDDDKAEEKKPAKKSTPKKAAKKAEPEEDEDGGDDGDDDWEI